MTDFGIARVRSRRRAARRRPAPSSAPATTSRPSRRRAGSVDERTDVYSLGIVLYELLTGEVPFTGENFVAVAMQHINAPPPPLTRASGPSVPPRLEAAVAKALAKDPADRFATMSAFAEELEACLAELRPAARAPRRRCSGRLPPARGRGRGAALGVACARRRRPGARSPPRSRRSWRCGRVRRLERRLGRRRPVAAARRCTDRTCAPCAPTTRTATTTSRTHSSSRYATDGKLATYWATEDYYDNDASASRASASSSPPTRPVRGDGR